MSELQAEKALVEMHVSYYVRSSWDAEDFRDSAQLRELGDSYRQTLHAVADLCDKLEADGWEIGIGGQCEVGAYPPDGVDTVEAAHARLDAIGLGEWKDCANFLLVDPDTGEFLECNRVKC